jgi:redox-sensing transcriptional repressor
MARLSRLVLERLMRYYRYIVSVPEMRGAKTVTSAQIATALDIDPTQVRKDFGAIGLLGMGRVGFGVCEVCTAIRRVMGFDERLEAVLVGAGHLGGALVAYERFTQYGLHIVAAFDTDKRKVGRNVGGLTVQASRALTPYIRRRGIRLAVLTTPPEVAQKVADRLVHAGVKAIWNFAPTRLTLPPGVMVRNEQIALGLSEISYHLAEQSRGG